MSKYTWKYRVPKKPCIDIMIKTEGGIHIKGPIDMKYFGYGTCGGYDIYHGREHIFIRLNDSIGVRLCDVKATGAEATFAAMKTVHKEGLGPKPVSMCKVSLMSHSLYSKPGKFPAGKYIGIIAKCIHYTKALDYVFEHIGIKFCSWERYFRLVKHMGEDGIINHTPDGLESFKKRVRGLIEKHKLIDDLHTGITYKKIGDTLYDTRTASWRLTDVR